MKAFRKEKLGVLIALYVVTGGLYGIYWITKNGFAASETTAERRTRALSAMLLGVLVVFISAVLLAMRSVVAREITHPVPSQIGVMLIIVALSAALIYLLAATISARIANAVRSAVATETHRTCSSLIAFLLTFLGFISALYLQYHINRLT